MNNDTAFVTAKKNAVNAFDGKTPLFRYVEFCIIERIQTRGACILAEELKSRTLIKNIFEEMQSDDELSDKRGMLYVHMLKFEDELYELAKETLNNVGTSECTIKEYRIFFFNNLLDVVIGKTHPRYRKKLEERFIESEQEAIARTNEQLKL